MFLREAPPRVLWVIKSITGDTMNNTSDWVEAAELLRKKSEIVALFRCLSLENQGKVLDLMRAWTARQSAEQHALLQDHLSSNPTRN